MQDGFHEVKENREPPHPLQFLPVIGLVLIVVLGWIWVTDPKK